jgi:Tfp pilus assembly protein PilO
MNADQLYAQLKFAVAVSGVLGLAFTGWNFYLQGKLREISALWKWKDEFEKMYQADQLASVKEFATKSEVKEAFDRLDHHMEEIRRSIDRLRDKLGKSED